MGKPTVEISADTRSRIERHIDDLASSDKATALPAERRLIRFGSKAVELLIEAANSVESQVRFRSVWALGKSRDERALPTILRLTKDLDGAVAYDAIMALGELGDMRAVPYLFELAAMPNDERSLVSASRTALARLGHPVDWDDEE